MIASFLITFRETLEAALVIGIVLAYLLKTKNTRFNKFVFSGIGIGILGSIIAAILFNVLASGFEGRSEEVFEGITMLLGAFLLTTMILWMMHNKHAAQDIKDKVSESVKKKFGMGIFFLIFVSVLREGVETVIFLAAASFAGSADIFGGIIGIIAATWLGFMMFSATKKFNIKKFFNVSSFLLLLFAAGLVAHGVHELEEAKILPPLIEHVWDINPAAPLADKGIYPLLHEKGLLGSIATGLFGYNGNPSLSEVIAYTSYLLVLAIAYFKIENIHLKKKLIEMEKSIENFA